MNHPLIILAQHSQNSLAFEGRRALARRARSFLGSSLVCAVALLGCSSEDGEPIDERTFAQQVEDGGALYGEHCATCHGDAGQGTSDGPAVVGDDALPLRAPSGAKREGKFRTAADIFGFTTAAMPGDDPGSLPDQEIVDILAFALFANGAELEKPLSLENAGSIVVNEDD